ncbi:MAG: ATP-binding protein [Wohlfahrtiimonas sp.]
MRKFFSLLSVRIFFVFLIYCIVVVSVAIIIPTLDQRRIREVPTVEREKIEQRLYRLLRTKHGNQGRFIAIPKTDDPEFLAYSIASVDNQDYREFIAAVVDESEPHQQSINSQMIMGPFEVDNLRYQFYLLFPKMPQSYYVSQMFSSPALLILLMMFASLPFIFILTYSLYRPIARLKRASEKVAQGYWETDPKLEKGTMEFVYLGASFNKMVMALQQAEAEKNRLFGNMSHELRTPLTRIRLTNGMLRRKADALLEPDIERIEQNLILIEDRIQAMLSLSRELILSREKYELIDLQEALLELLAEATFEAEANGKSLVYQDLPNAQLLLNVENFRSGIENILRNAIHYSDQTIEVTFKIENEQLSITVADDGPGVKPTDLERLFEAFYRSENTEVADSHGAGLGLAIAGHMVKSHNGTIKAKNGENKGLVIILTLPIARAQ